MPGDLVLAGGLVVDGTGAPPRRAPVLVREGRVYFASPDGAACRDVTGLVVCPGFVDIHTHSDLTLLSDPRGLSKVHQGVTTEVVGNCGLGVVPSGVDGLRAAVSYLDLDPAIEWTWTDLAGYLSRVEQERPGLNVAALVGHLPLRAAVCGFEDRAATAADLDRMTGLLRDALDAGAVGLSTGLVYAPLPYAREDELVALAATTEAAGKVFTWHVRDYEDGLLASVEQAVRVARATGCRTQLSHLQAVGRRNWDQAYRVLDLVDAARADGIDIAVDVYPYLHGNAPLAQLLPAWAQEGGPAAWAPTLREPRVRERIREAWRDRPIGWDQITIGWTAGESPAVGRTVEDLAVASGADGTGVVLDLLAELGTGVMMTAGGRSEDVLRAVLAHPSAVIASDGLALDPDGVTGAGLPHPRSYGCFPRYLSRYATGADLADAVRRCTSAPAARVGLTDRGVLREGAPADIVVFDPATLGDTATFAAPHRYPTGIDLVLVNGVAVVDSGRHTGERPGRVLGRNRGVAHGRRAPRGPRTGRMKPTPLTELPTPALLVDLDRLERNIDRMARAYAAAGIALRPHVKTSKCWEVARRQLDAGAIGFTCSTPGEIAWLQGNGVGDLLWAHVPVGPRKVEFTVATARMRGGLTVALDSVEAATPLSAAAAAAGVSVPFVLEVNTGQARLGVEPEKAVPTAGAIAALPGLRLRGVLTHEGHIYQAPDRQELEKAGTAAGTLLVSVAEALRDAGHRPEIVSVGSTPGATSTPFAPGVTEARPGTYVYFDANQTRLGSCAPDDCALTVLARVVSVQRDGRAITDGGSKSTSSDSVAATGSFGLVCDPAGGYLDAVTFFDANEEHGFLAAGSPLRVGDLVRVVPNHACGTTNMWSHAYAVRGGTAVEDWAIEARH